MIRITAEQVASQTLPVWFDVSVMTVNGLFGAAIARRRSAPVIGTLFAAVLVGLGGGMVRDMLLGLEPVAISHWFYIPAVLLGGVVGALVFGRVLRKQRHFALAHGLVLGFLVTIGAQKALNYDTPVVSAMALGVVTASFGGMLADVLSGHGATIAQQAHWIASALILGSITFVLISIWVGFWPAVIVAVAVTTTLRYFGQVRNWPSPRWPGEMGRTLNHPTP